MWRPTARLIVPLRDLICLGVGVWGVVHEELAATPDLGRLGFFGLLMVAPGALAARWLTRSDTASVSSPPPVPPAASSSPSSGGS